MLMEFLIHEDEDICSQEFLLKRLPKSHALVIDDRLEYK